MGHDRPLVPICEFEDINIDPCSHIIGIVLNTSQQVASGVVLILRVAIENWEASQDEIVSLWFFKIHEADDE